MCAVAEKAEVTPEGLMAMQDEDAYELVGGRLVERNGSVLSSWVGGQTLFLIGTYLNEHPIGLAFNSSIGYHCFPDEPRKVRRARGSVIKNERLPGDWQKSFFSRVAPDLVIEVIAPNDLAVELDKKLLDFLQVGVSLVWVVNPDIRTVNVFRHDFTGNTLNENDELSGENVLPGFRCRVADLFPPHVPDAPEAQDVPT